MSVTCVCVRECVVCACATLCACVPMCVCVCARSCFVSLTCCELLFQDVVSCGVGMVCVSFHGARVYVWSFLKVACVFSSSELDRGDGIRCEPACFKKQAQSQTRTQMRAEYVIVSRLLVGPPIHPSLVVGPLAVTYCVYPTESRIATTTRSSSRCLGPVCACVCVGEGLCFDADCYSWHKTMGEGLCFDADCYSWHKPRHRHQASTHPLHTTQTNTHTVPPSHGSRSRRGSHRWSFSCYGTMRARAKVMVSVCARAHMRVCDQVWFCAVTVGSFLS